MDLNKEYVGSSLKIEISDLDLNNNIEYKLDFICGNHTFPVVKGDHFDTSDNWDSYVITEDGHTYVFIPDGEFVGNTGILTLIVTQLSFFGTSSQIPYKTISQPIPLVELVKMEGYLDTCDGCFDVYESNGDIAVKCNVYCEGKYVKIYQNKSCDGQDNVKTEAAPQQFSCGVACLGTFDDGIYSLTVGNSAEYNATDEYPIKDIYILNGLVEEVVEDLVTVLCNCGCPSCLECNEIDEDYMKDLMTNLNTLLIGYSDRLKEPIEVVKAQLRCDIIPSDLADKCKKKNYAYTGKNDNNAQFKKLAAFYYLVLAQDWLTNAQWISKLCEESGTDITLADLPEVFDYAKVSQCLRALSIEYKLEIPKVEKECNNDSELQN